jgi:hypothetical protein
MVLCSNQVSYLPDGTEYSGIAGPVVRVRYIRNCPGRFQQWHATTMPLQLIPMHSEGVLVPGGGEGVLPLPGGGC